MTSEFVFFTFLEFVWKAGMYLPVAMVTRFMLSFSRVFEIHHSLKLFTLRLLLLAGTNFSVLVVCCIWQVFILAFLR